MSLRVWLVVSVVLLLPVHGLWADTFIGNYSSWDGVNTYSWPIGHEIMDVATQGQSFVAPATADHFLDYFSLAVKMDNTSDPFRAEIWGWSPGSFHPIGSALWSSGATTVAAPNTFQKFTFNTGGLDLTAGGNYYMLITRDRDPGGSATGGIGLIANGSDTYTDGWGAFNWSHDPTTWPTDAFWDMGYNFPDAAFEANFNDGGGGGVPEPGTMALLVVGLAGFGGLRRKLRKG
jgi:hypothetical protein